MVNQFSTLIVCAGLRDNDAWLQNLARSAHQVVAVDGGADWLVAAEIMPDLFFGDCDSIDPSVLDVLRKADVEMNFAEVDKDQTDFELALAASVTNSADARILVAGAFGGRVDHELANLMLIADPRFIDSDITLVSSTQQARCVNDNAVFEVSDGKILSLIPVGGEATVQSTQGLKWALTNQVLKFGPSLGISNLITGTTANLEVNQGGIIAIQTLE